MEIISHQMKLMHDKSWNLSHLEKCLFQLYGFNTNYYLVLSIELHGPYFAIFSQRTGCLHLHVATLHQNRHLISLALLCPTLVSQAACEAQAPHALSAAAFSAKHTAVDHSPVLGFRIQGLTPLRKTTNRGHLVDKETDLLKHSPV